MQRICNAFELKGMFTPLTDCAMIVVGTYTRLLYLEESQCVGHRVVGCGIRGICLSR